MKNHIEIVHVLRSAASEIRSLRRQVTEVKAEAWDFHSAVISRLLIRDGGMSAGICPASYAEKIAQELEREAQPETVETERPRDCLHRKVTVTDGEGYCDTCGHLLDYDKDTRNWVKPPEKTHE